MDALLWQEKALSLLDQSKFPQEELWYDCKDLAGLLHALRMPGAVCGEALLACAGAYGYCLAALEHEGSPDFFKLVSAAKQAILETRPQATALRAALARMDKAYEEYKNSPELITALLATAVTIHRQDVVACRAMGRLGREILSDEAKIALSCRGGVFHTGAQGGPIGVLTAAVQQKKNIEVFVCENDPKRAGYAVARELAAKQIPTTVIPDQTAAALMPLHNCHMVLIEGLGATANGDLLAGPGAYALAIAAYFHSIPVYATLYCSDIDTNLTGGDAYPPALFQFAPRGEDDLHVPEGVSVCAPQHELVLHQLLTGLITDKGLIFPPFDETIPETLTKEPNKPVLIL